MNYGSFQSGTKQGLSSKKICKLGCCPLFSMFARQRGEINISSLTFLRLSLRPVRAAFIAAPKALKSYFGTGLFAIVIHPVTFYCSPFFLDMSTQFNQLAKIIHMYMLTISRFFCIVLLKGGNVYVTQHAYSISIEIKKDFSHFQYGLFCHAYFAYAIQQN